jgi:ribosomal protein L7/L12
MGRSTKTPATDELIESVDVHVREGNLITAIKRLRELFPEMSLKQAHDVIRYDWIKFQAVWRS